MVCMRTASLVPTSGELGQHAKRLLTESCHLLCPPYLRTLHRLQACLIIDCSIAIYFQQATGGKTTYSKPFSLVARLVSNVIAQVFARPAARKTDRRESSRR